MKPHEDKHVLHLLMSQNFSSNIYNPFVWYHNANKIKLHSEKLRKLSDAIIGSTKLRLSNAFCLCSCRSVASTLSN